ncbi:22743_t:CDS:1, partial [Gigaspora rosea]
MAEDKCGCDTSSTSSSFTLLIQGLLGSSFDLGERPINIDHTWTGSSFKAFPNLDIIEIFLERAKSGQIEATSHNSEEI